MDDSKSRHADMVRMLFELCYEARSFAVMPHNKMNC